MTKKPASFYFYGSPTGLGPSIIMAAGIGALMGELIALPFKTPFYVAALAKYLRSRPHVQKAISSLPQKQQEEAIRESLYRLREKNLITYRKKKGKIELILTSKGKERFERLTIDLLTIPQPAVWDGKWRLLLFDIPEKARDIRDAFRKRIRQMGFFPLQQSVWIHPYPCEKEIGALAHLYRIEKNVLSYTITIENDSELRKYFKLP